MKHLILLLAFIGLSLPDILAQNHGTTGIDTFTVSSAVDTGYWYIGVPANSLAEVTLAKQRDLSSREELEMHIRLDSLSGAAGGTLTIEYTNSDSPTEIGAEWYTAPAATSLFTYMNGTTVTTAASTSAFSFTTNGTRSILIWRDSAFNAKHARARYVVASSSQSLKMRGWWSVR